MKAYPEILIFQFNQIEKLGKLGDEEVLLDYLKESHILIKRKAALELGHLRARKALPYIRCLANEDRGGVNASGHFDVAIVLLACESREQQKSALLRVACEDPGHDRFRGFVVDEAGRELSRFADEEIVKQLTDVASCGAQYTVLKYQCAKLPQTEAINRCISLLEDCPTMEKSKAAAELLAEFGRSALQALEELLIRLEKKLEIGGPDRVRTLNVRNDCRELINWLWVESEWLGQAGLERTRSG
ncbi:MAG TPA: hypothetical protein VJ952_05530 [Opitutales bacterium]|nr:hypothetical protein [Opitutales bacterium]